MIMKCVCGFKVVISRKIVHGKKRAAAKCPNCGAYAPLRVRNGRVRGLERQFSKYFVQQQVFA